VAGVVGPFNGNVAKAEMPISNQAPIALISPANTNQCLTKNTPESGCTGSANLIPTLRPSGKVTYFRIATTDDHQGPAMADYLYKTLHYKTVYVIDDAETYGIGIANTFSKEWQSNGGTVLGRSSEPSTTTSYVSVLTQIAPKHPDVIYFGGNNSTGGDLIRQQMQQVPGLQTTPLAGGDGVVTSDYSHIIPFTKGGPTYGTVATVDEALANGAHTPQNSSDTAGAQAFRQAVINAIQNISFDGVLGHQSFDANGDTTNKVITIYKVGPNPANVPVGTPGWNPVATVKIP
jgi:branched-chain amino acid transport system substrate-binding protein